MVSKILVIAAAYTTSRNMYAIIHDQLQFSVCLAIILADHWVCNNNDALVEIRKIIRKWAYDFKHRVHHYKSDSKGVFKYLDIITS